MPPIRSKPVASMKRGQTQETVLNVYDFMRKTEQQAKGREPEHYRKQLLKVQKRVKEATEVSERTIGRIL
jgi:hypothetical protein